MSIPKVSFEETLKKFVVEANLCFKCASCVISCPFNCLEYAEGPKIVGECRVCGICAQVCPRFNVSFPSVERFVFGRERGANEDFGIYRRIEVAQTVDDEVMKVCQDGGVVTSLLISMLKEGIIQGVAASCEDDKNPLRAIPMLALSREDLIKCSGTRYTYSPNLLAFKDGVQKRISKLAFTGTPCQIHAIRRIQMLPLKKHADALRLTIGLFCSECFTYDGLVKTLLQEKMGIKLDAVRGINIKGKLLIKMKNGEVKSLPLKEAKSYACKFCSACSDFSAELADISVGGLGFEGWTLTIIRTEVGEKAFRWAESNGILRVKPVEDSKVIDLLVKMSRRKRESAKSFGSA